MTLASMRVVSVNVGRIQPMGPAERRVTSAFLKTPVEGPVAVGGRGLDGDEQADRSVHGGGRSAVYAYPIEHYEYWSERLNGRTMPPGTFGENLTTLGWTEEQVVVGETVQIGSAELEVTRPRLPCYKMELRFERPGMIAEFLASGRTGFYLSVRRPGVLRAGDPVIRRASPKDAPTIASVVDRARSGRAS